MHVIYLDSIYNNNLEKRRHHFFCFRWICFSQLHRMWTIRLKLISHMQYFSHDILIKIHFCIYLWFEIVEQTNFNSICLAIDLLTCYQNVAVNIVIKRYFEDKIVELNMDTTGIYKTFFLNQNILGKILLVWERP